MPYLKRLGLKILVHIEKAALLVKSKHLNLYILSYIQPRPCAAFKGNFNWLVWVHVYVACIITCMFTRVTKCTCGGQVSTFGIYFLGDINLVFFLFYGQDFSLACGSGVMLHSGSVSARDCLFFSRIRGMHHVLWKRRGWGDGEMDYHAIPLTIFQRTTVWFPTSTRWLITIFNSSSKGFNTVF